MSYSYGSMDELKEKKPEHPPASNPTQCLTQLMMSQEMADLTIVFPSHYEKFKVHRLVLGMWSSVFQAMLFGPMAEGDTITLAEDSPQSFKWLLNYMYKGQTTLPSVKLALEVYLLANKYIMRHLKTVCSEYLISNVSAVSVPEVLNLATLLEDEALINKCAVVLEKSPDTFFSSPTIGTLSSDALKQLLGKDLPVSSESVIFKGILNWGRAHLKSLGKAITTTTLRQEVNEILPHVLFLTMSLEEFVKHVLPEDILTFKEVQAIQLNIAGVPEVSLPPLFSTKKEERNRFHISHLDKCHIMSGGINSLGSYRGVSNIVILSEIQSVKIIYLSKLEYDVRNNPGYKATLIVNDSSGKEIQTAHFDGQVAEFNVPLQMLPEEKYTFTLSVNEYKDVTTNSYFIAHNGLISGYMMNGYFGLRIIRYWK